MGQADRRPKRRRRCHACVLRLTASRARGQTSNGSRLTVFVASHRPPRGPAKWSGIMPMFCTGELPLCSTSPGLVGITMRSAYWCLSPRVMWVSATSTNGAFGRPGLHGRLTDDLRHRRAPDDAIDRARPGRPWSATGQTDATPLAGESRASRLRRYRPCLHVRAGICPLTSELPGGCTKATRASAPMLLARLVKLKEK